MREGAVEAIKTASTSAQTTDGMGARRMPVSMHTIAHTSCSCAFGRSGRARNLHLRACDGMSFAIRSAILSAAAAERTVVNLGEKPDTCIAGVHRPTM